MKSLSFYTMPNIFGLHVWGCTTPQYTFVITEDVDRFSALVKDKAEGDCIELGGFAAHSNFEEARQACVNFLIARDK